MYLYQANFQVVFVYSSVVFIGLQRSDMLLRRFVSKIVVWKGMAILAGVGLPLEVIYMCFRDCSSNQVEAVQMGLIKWRDGGGYSPTWTVLLNAMAHVEIPGQHITKLKEELLRGAHVHAFSVGHASQQFHTFYTVLRPSCC